MLKCDICFQPANRKTKTGKVLCNDCYQKHRGTIALTPIEACTLAYSQLTKVKLTEDVRITIDELSATIDKYTN